MNVKIILHSSLKETLPEKAIYENKILPTMAMKMNRWRLKRIQTQRRKNLLQMRQAQWHHLVDYLKRNNQHLY